LAEERIIMVEEYAQERPQIVQEEMPVPPISEEIWRTILDRSMIPDVLIHNLKGEVWVKKINPKTNEVEGWWERKGEPLMNEKGIRFFSSFLYSAMSIDKITTFLTEEEVARLTHDMVETIIFIIGERGDEFGIDAANRRYIVDLLESFYFSNLTASRKGTILAALKPSYERKEIYMPEKKKRGIPLVGGLFG